MKTKKGVNPIPGVLTTIKRLMAKVLSSLVYTFKARN